MPDKPELRVVDASAEDGLVALIERLDADNEYLRQRNLEVMEWMEEAVTAQVSGERRAVELERQIDALESELDAIHRSVTWRTLLPIRAVYGRMRRGSATS